MKSLLYWPLAFIMFFLLACKLSANAGISIINADSPGEGLNDNTSANPVTGNPGITVGQQRLFAFQAAADVWATYLNNNQPIAIYTQMNPLTCSSSNAVLGAAGATTATRDFLNAPQPATFYPIALAQELAGEELVTFPEIVAEFNSSIGATNCLTGVSWWYGIGGNQPGNTLSFYDTVLHEIAHGLGFYTYVNANGVRLTTNFSQWNDHYMLHLKNNLTGKVWTEMTDTERAASSQNNQLVWNGAAATAASLNINTGKNVIGNPEIYAPSTYRQGSSVSHWDVDVSPDELMEPFANSVNLDVLTKKLFCDIGWPAPGCNSITPAPTLPPPIDEVVKKKPFVSRMFNILLPALQEAEVVE